ncbi:reverse transcriptase domain-containing protein [Streptomyces sp. NBC_01549]|uniref:reverse transcriptase/maturase family protein n=1 Tax=unclassified Streptomyces TaxID=2593676 RepID=UPI002251A71D|nr:reverse transcriptase/maturase family protein [Streptomyces sp. NBC_01549]MCX4593226.1 reverse transcriptase domain-containing protein [Streptomyces sp. NBC_01549]MCX4597457.1 reverse transcriptase domain-containing protein [Streptomyces sp. NBC_01549]
MQNAGTVLDVIRKRGERGLPVERLYRQLFNPQLYLLAYGRIYANKGAMTPGVSAETADDMSLEKIDSIIDALRAERYRWSPARRVYIEKKGSTKKRPLGLPTWSDKLVAEAVRLLLEAYYDVQFSDRSHGFRPQRGCHTALTEVARTWRGVHWFIEGDISDCFGSLDHEVMLKVLGEKIHDGRFLRLISRMLKAGYLEDWKWNATLSGSPQGGVASPILSNIYLDRLDRFVEQSLLPEYNLGDRRRPNPAYLTVQHAIAKARRHQDREAVRVLRHQQRSLPYGDPNDPSYRRLRYVRYADDFLLGFAGSKREAQDITSKIRAFLREQLRLELSESKTLITHATSQAARFLGYEIRALHADTKITDGRRSINGTPGLFVPEQVIRTKSALYKKKGKPAPRGVLLHDEDFSIVAKYQAEYRGLIQYYLLAQNVHRLSKLHWIMETSLLKTLACKYRSTVRKMSRKFRATVETPHGPRRCLQVTVERKEGKKPLVARFGGIPLKRERTATLADVRPVTAPAYNELIKRLLAEYCELCETRTDLEVHHIRHLADLKQPGRRDKPAWIQLMARRRRKTLVLCRTCHVSVHAGRVSQPLRT